MNNEITITHERQGEPAKDLRILYSSMLVDKFGIDTVSGLPIWRIVWAPDQYNKMLDTYKDFTPSGIFIREVREVREIPKYSHLGGLYILEMLMGIPSINAAELPTGKLSYECMHPYMHAINGTYLPPNWPLTEWICDCWYAARGKQSLRKYLDPDADGNNGLDAAKIRYKKILEGLYGNHTDVSDALGDGSGVFIDSTKTKGSIN